MEINRATPSLVWLQNDPRKGPDEEESYKRSDDASRGQRGGCGGSVGAATSSLARGGRRAARGDRVQPAPTGGDRLPGHADSGRGVSGGADAELRNASGHLREALRGGEVLPLPEAVQAGLRGRVFQGGAGASGRFGGRVRWTPAAGPPRQVCRCSPVRRHGPARAASRSESVAQLHRRSRRSQVGRGLQPQDRAARRGDLCSGDRVRNAPVAQARTELHPSRVVRLRSRILRAPPLRGGPGPRRSRPHEAQEERQGARRGAVPRWQPAARGWMVARLLPELHAHEEKGDPLRSRRRLGQGQRGGPAASRRLRSLLEADPLVSHDRPALHALGSPGDRDLSPPVAHRVFVPRAEAERRPGPLLHRQFPRHRGVDLWRHARSRPRTLAPNRGRPPKRDPHRATSTARVPPRRSCLRPRYRRRAGILQPNSLRRPPRAHDSDPARHRPGTETVTFAHENFPHTRGCRCLSDRGWVIDGLTSNDGLISATLSMESDWGSGYRARVNLTSTARNPSTSWTVVINLNGSTLAGCDLSTCTVSGGQLTVRSLDWNRAVSSSQSQSFGFNGNGSSGRPTIVSVTQSGASGGSGGTG